MFNSRLAMANLEETQFLSLYVLHQEGSRYTFPREVLGEARHAVLGCRVVGAAEKRHMDADDRRDVDNPALAELKRKADTCANW